MGVIERSIRKRSNQKLAAAVYTSTQHSFEEVVAVVQSFCDQSNTEVTNVIKTNQARPRPGWASGPRACPIRKTPITTSPRTPRRGRC